MKFNRLRLLGFKSFVEPAEFVIERGLTGVVGPNGCGKSNLVEALRWVMGESSYKNMRASGMDDVIFSGSATRPARNTAEVTLFLDNGDRTAPAAFNDADELQVSRRIEREAGSIYRINGKEARAKDVQLLFADQSTGARSPSMVGQGRIGELIQAKPQARRALLEEAAGISGLHTRRHEAELRLRAAEQNLERLDDVVGELESQIESLKRQARQASRFKNLSADIRKAEATLLHLRWTLAKAHEAEAQSALAVATALVAERASAQMNAAKEQAIGAHRLPELRDAEAAAAAAFQRLSIARAQLEEEAGRMRARQAELDKRIAQLDADIAREQQMLHDNADILQRLADEEATLSAENAAAAGGEDRLQAAVAEATATLTASEAALAKLTAERAEAAAARNQYRALAARRRRAPRPPGAAARRCRARGRRDRARGSPCSPIRRKSGCWSRTPRHRWPASEQAALAAEKAVADAAAERGDAARAAARGQGRAGAHRDRGAHAGEDPECLRPATCSRQCSSRSRSSAVTRRRWAPRSARISTLRSTATRRPIGAAASRSLAIPPCRRRPCRWPASSRRRRSLPADLAQIGIVDAADAERLQMLAPGQRLVSRDGALWRWDGMVASADAPTAAAQRLAQKNRLAELDAEAVAATKRVRAAEQALADAERAQREGTEAERAAQAGLARRAASARRRARCPAEGRKSGRRTHCPPRGACRSAVRASTRRMPRRRAQSPRPQRGLDAAPDLTELQAAFDRLAADGAARPCGAGRRARPP